MDLWIARQNPARKGVLLPIPGTGGVMIPLHKMGKNQLEEVIDWQLEKNGIPKEERQKLREQAELDHENRIKVNLVRQEIRRRLEGSSPQMSKKGGRWTFTK
jgi:hypothetical protein